MPTVTTASPSTRRRLNPPDPPAERAPRPYPPAATADPPSTPALITIIVSLPDGRLTPPALRMIDSLHALADRHCAVLRIEPARPPIMAPAARPVTAMALRTAARQLVADGLPIHLTRREYDLLAFLCRHPRQVFARTQLLRLVWGHQLVGAERTVDVHVRRLRVKLGDGGPRIVSVRGVGYRLDDIDRITVTADPGQDCSG